MFRVRRVTTYLLVIFSGMSASSAISAEDVLRCVSPQGDITYLNDKPLDKSLKCEKTNLGTVDKKTTLNKPFLAPLLGLGHLQTEDKEIENQKVLSLRKELAQEKIMFETIGNMLKNVEASGDAEQINKLKSMLDGHRRKMERIAGELSSSTEVKLNKDMTSKVSVMGQLPPPVAMPPGLGGVGLPRRLEDSPVISRTQSEKKISVKVLPDKDEGVAEKQKMEVRKIKAPVLQIQEQSKNNPVKAKKVLEENYKKQETLEISPSQFLLGK